MPRRIRIAEGQAALEAWKAATAEAPDAPVARATLATAVRFTLEELAARHPGRSVEVRVPPFGVVQCIEGPRHTRGIPPAVVEMGPAPWLSLVVGRTEWAAALAQGGVSASGERTDLSGALPLFG